MGHPIPLPTVICLHPCKPCYTRSVKLYELRNCARTVSVLLTIAAAAAISNGTAFAATTADIVWTKSVDETGRPSDVLTGGTLLAAVTAGRTATVNGVKFAGQTPSKTPGLILFGAAPITVEAVQDSFGQYGGPPAKWDAGYRLLVSGGAYSQYPTSAMKIQITGLTVGHKYAVQIFECFWNTNFATVFVSGQNSSSALNLSGAAATGSAASGTPQYVTGTFVADSESASISLTSHTGYVIFDAMQVRDMGVPTAATPARN